MIRCLVVILSLISACASPSAGYLGTPAVTVERGGRTFQVFLRRDGGLARAQVIRRGWVAGHDHRPIRADMIAAAEIASGCTALPGEEGDSGVLNLSLNCPQ